MLKAYRSQDGKPIPRPNLVANPTDFTDTTFHAYSEKIEDDYTYILKRAVVPGLGDIGILKLRELRVLVSLDFFDAPLTPVQVSELLRYDPATVTRASERLITEGHIVKADNIRDTRSILLIPTDSGKALAKAYRDQVQLVFSRLEQDLSVQFDDAEKLEYLNMIVKVSKRSGAMRSWCKQRKWKS